MSTNKLISKIFLPRHCLKAQAGYIVGWNVRSFVTCVATIISDIELHELDRVLSSLSEHEEIRNSPCGPPVVLGEWLVNESPESSKSEDDDNSDIKILKSNKVNEESIWIMMDRDPSPTLKEIYCYGYRYQTSAQVVVYSQSTPQHFFWPDPIHLDDKSHKKEEELTELEEALQQVNISASVEKLLFREIRKTAFEPMTHGLLRYWLLSTSIMYFIMIYTPIASQILHFVNYKIPFINKSLAEISVTGRHMDSRIRLVVQWKSKFQKLHTEWNRNTPESRSNYLNFYNELWLIVNDLFFGIIVGTLLLYNRDFIIENVDKANHFLTNNILKQLIAWLMGWPAGFKLNDELDEFLGVVFMFYIDRWTEVLMWFQPFQPLIVTFVSSTGFVGGLSLIIALGIDILNFFTFHIYCFYTASARIYLLQLNILSSLWKLFRGKKYNPLKDRIDSCDFNIDQLLLGTLLFTLFFFLLPTTGIYYVFFTLVRIFLTSLKCVLVFVMDLLEHFPLYPVVIYFVDNAFLPGGVWLEVCNNSFAPLEEEEDTGVLSNVLKLLVMDSPEIKPMKGGTKTPLQRKQHAYLVLKNRKLAFGTLFVHVLKCVEPLFKAATWKKLFT